MLLVLGISLTLSNKGKSPTLIIVNAFEARVIADGGVFEAKACLDAQLTILKNISWVY